MIPACGMSALPAKPEIEEMCCNNENNGWRKDKQIM